MMRTHSMTVTLSAPADYTEDEIAEMVADAVEGGDLSAVEVQTHD
jgi:hypothetical protein